MREIKFRAKRIDNGKWVYGTYYEHLQPLQAFTAKGQEVEKSKYYIALCVTNFLAIKTIPF